MALIECGNFLIDSDFVSLVVLKKGALECRRVGTGTRL